MTSDKGDKGSHRIPIRFDDADDQVEADDLSSAEPDLDSEDLFEGGEVDTEEPTGGPDTAELIATRSDRKSVV